GTEFKTPADRMAAILASMHLTNTTAAIGGRANSPGPNPAGVTVVPLTAAASELPEGRELDDQGEAKPTPNIDRLRNRGDTQYGKWVDEASRKYSADPDAVASIVMHESNGNPNARNKKSSATGLGQFIGRTWAKIKDSVVQDAYGDEIEDGK